MEYVLQNTHEPSNRQQRDEADLTVAHKTANPFSLFLGMRGSVTATIATFVTNPPDVTHWTKDLHRPPPMPRISIEFFDV